MSAKRIVIIDDDPEICDALSENLSQYGYQVVTALDTHSGYRLFVEAEPDLLILDIMMETMDEGLNFATKIRKDEGVHGVPILIVSARPPVEQGYARTLSEDLEYIKKEAPAKRVTPKTKAQLVEEIEEATGLTLKGLEKATVAALVALRDYAV